MKKRFVRSLVILLACLPLACEGPGGAGSAEACATVYKAMEQWFLSKDLPPTATDLEKETKRDQYTRDLKGAFDTQCVAAADKCSGTERGAIKNGTLNCLGLPIDRLERCMKGVPRAVDKACETSMRTVSDLLDTGL